MDVQQMVKAIEDSGSVRAAAKVLAVSYTTLQWHLAKNGLEVVKSAKVVNKRFTLTQKGKRAVKAIEEGK